MTAFPTISPYILCVHQGGELYGSDRSFLQVVQALRETWPAAYIKVVLAVDGPLRRPLRDVADEVQIRDLCVLRLANLSSTLLKSTVALPWYVLSALRDIVRADLAYINTTVIADYMIAARFASQKSVIHAREIPKAKAMPIVRRLLSGSRARIIYNSHATMAAFAIPHERSQVVLHNGVDPIIDAEAPNIAEFSPERPLRLAMLGRISDWKGQDLLIDGIAALSPAHRARTRVRIVGSTFRDAREPIDALETQIANTGLTGIVTLESFKEDPSEVYRWADVCVVPSRLPEPFGRVAAEAMAHARPVIAANHGGLIELIEDGQSGWLFQPNNPSSLASAIQQAINENGMVQERGVAALARFETYFSTNTMRERLCEIMRCWIPALK